ncbi:aspartyl/glutamyl-tRNA amidotransferase subunit A [Patescibacteria group bacterium]|nr:aspartyl/glutamyl-tRNA amidotransferase subunit A [Patescibacteria group bacterium]MBU1885860.1 aspartyl/glutamyl-tRNA amidotransferase subunit A [Patescibacteria group bacterium]
MLNKLTLKQAIDKLDNKKITLEDIWADVLSAIKNQNDKLNVYLAINKNFKSQPNKPLKGLPIAVKDNFCTKGTITTASSLLLKDFVPQFESTVTQKLKDAGGEIVGKTNMDAWAHGSSTETSQYGKTLNPRNTQHLPGGSSGGSAAAVAADMCIASLGSETAGSIRQPAAWCGVVGLKPTYGRTSRYGIVAMASSTDSPGPITKTVEDAAILLNHIAGHDPLNATSSSEKTPNFTESLDKPIENLKIGIIYHNLEGLENVWKLFAPQLKIFTKLGASVKYAQAMDPKHAISVYTVVQRSEVSSNLARFDDVRYQHGRDTFGNEAKKRIMLGTHTLSKVFNTHPYSLAQKVRTLLIKDYEKLFKKYDVLISLTSPGFAKKVGATEGSAMFGELEDMLMEVSSLSGMPGISIPCYRDEKTNLYLGMNIMAPMWREDLVIQVADAFEKNTDWNSWRKND